MLRCDGSSRDSQFSCCLSQLGAVKEEKSVAAVRAEYNGQKLEVGRSSTSSNFRFSLYLIHIQLKIFNFLDIRLEGIFGGWARYFYCEAQAQGKRQH